MDGHQTAIHRTKPSVPARWLTKQGLLIGRLLDFGCGRGTDAAAFGMDAYDPHWRSDLKSTGPYDTILCIYVLNVVSEETQEEILAELRSLLSVSGHAYVAVRRDLPREGRKGRGVWQRYVVLDEPLVREISTYAIYQVASRSMALTRAAASMS